MQSRLDALQRMPETGRGAPAAVVGSSGVGRVRPPLGQEITPEPGLSTEPRSRDITRQQTSLVQPLDYYALPVLRTPELDTALQGESHQSGVEGQNHLPRPAAHTAFDAPQDMVGLLGCMRTLPDHIQLFIHQYPQVLLRRAALNPFIP